MYRGGVYPSYVHYFSSAVRPVYKKKRKTVSSGNPVNKENLLLFSRHD